MKIDLNIKNFVGLKNRISSYFKKHTEQSVVVIILIVVAIAAMLSSILFYHFTINPKEPTESEIGYRKTENEVREEVLQNIKDDKIVDKSEKINSTGDPFNK